MLAQGAPPCSSAVVAAAQALGSDGAVEARACPGTNRVVLVLRPDGAPPLEVEATIGAGGFREAGAFALSPILNAEWDTVPVPQRAAFDALAERLTTEGGALVRALAAGEAPPGFLPEVQPEPAPPPPQAPLHPGAILALFALGAAWLRPDRRAVAALLGLFGLGLTLRLALGIWAPLRINGLGSLWLLGAWGQPELLVGYGTGYPELFTWVARAFSPPDHAVFGANALLSALTGPVAALLALALGLGRGRALLAGLLFALDPVWLRGAASETYFVAISLALLLGALGLVSAGRDDAPLPTRLALGLGGALALVFAARIHPLAWPLAAGVPFLLLAGERAWPVLLGRVAAAGAAIGLLALPFRASLAEVLRRLDPGAPGPLESGLEVPGPDFLVTALLCLLALRSLPDGRRLLRFGLACLPLVAVHAATHYVFAQSDVWHGSYQHVALGPVAVLTLALIPERRLRLVGGLLLAGLGVFAVLSWPADSTEQLEYRWLREQLAEQPEGCRVAYLHRAGPRHVILLPEHLVPGWSCGTTSGIRLGDAALLQLGLGPGVCRRYVRTSLCSRDEARAACEELERSVRLTPIATTTLPAEVSNDAEPYGVDAVDIGIYEVAPR